MTWLEALDSITEYQTLLAVFAACVGGLWAANAHFRRREHDPRIQFRVYVRFVGNHAGHWVVELLAIVENRGQVPHRMVGLEVNLRGLKDGDPMIAGPERINRQLEFKHELVPPPRSSERPDPGNRGRNAKVAAAENNVSLISKIDGNRVILYPGTSMRYMHVACIEDSVRFILIHGHLTRVKGQPLRADRVIAVPNVPAASSSA